MMTRRQAIKTTALAGAALAVAPAMAQAQPTAPAASLPTPFTLPALPYAYDALEPHIDAETMHIHHDKHHAAYVANLNKAWSQMAWGGALPTFDYLENNWLKNEKFLSENPAIRNNGGGHYNHSLFWKMMKPNGGGAPSGDLAKAIDSAFGSFSTFKDNFSKAALGQFGSGWAWLVLDGKTLKIMPTPNQDTPLSLGKTPLLGIDIWEHAYYLKYQNKRADYISAWWNVVDWDFAADRLAKASA
ncbi:MAG TPA: superoxide dismutase [Verrucomicrobiae bacterium]|jgi:Fe-Mn family superoxide dismutase